MIWTTMQPRWRIITVIGVFTFFILLISNGGMSPKSGKLYSNYSNFRNPNYRGLANSTLGFQKIVSVSGENPETHLAWRRKGLVAAANRTDILLHIEETHNMPAEEVDRILNIKTQSGNPPGPGSAKAWAAHERVLREIVAQKITSALVVEDDIDWEVDIKKQLAPAGPIASAIRKLSVSDESLDIVSSPYGNTWDILWMGHCGMRGPSKFGKTSRFNITFPDDLVLPTNTLSVWDGKPFEGPPDGHRQVRLGSEVLCTLAYAITWQAAERLLAQLAKGGGHGAYDIQLTDFCSYGAFRCLTINPELMHDQAMNGGPGSLINSKSAPDKNRKEEDLRPVTWNLRYSARCNAGVVQQPLKQCLPRRQAKALGVDPAPGQ